MKYTVKVQRVVPRRNDSAAKEQVQHLIRRALGGQRGKSWACSGGGRSKTPTEAQDGWLYKYTLTFQYNGRSRQAAQRSSWHQVLSYLIKTGQGSVYGSQPWQVFVGDKIVNIDQDTNTIQTVEKQKSTKQHEYAALPEIEKSDYFDHIYNRESQILRVLSAIGVARATNFEERNHVVLHGPPGSGKTEILLAVRKMLGEASVLLLDATSTTAAGAIKKLLDEPTLPRILIIEEMEKREEKELRWLLSPLDIRGEIRKLNFRVEAARDVRMLCLATVNDMDLFRRVCAGAIYSRFSGNRIYCGHPDEETMRKILRRDVSKVHDNWKEEWIDQTIEFCMKELKWTDPREVKPICTQGQDSLITGEYQLAVLKSMPQTEIPQAGIKDMELIDKYTRMKERQRQ